MKKTNKILALLLTLFILYGFINSLIINKYGTLTEGKVINMGGKFVTIEYLNQNMEVCECALSFHNETSKIGNLVTSL